jgi:mannose-6-phosphate isomerase-like protein (cupin superfamily)
MKRIVTSLVLMACSPACITDDSSETREVLLDNAAVEVVRLTYPAGSESGMHTHVYPNRVAYVVTGGKLEMVPGDPEQPRQRLKVTAGQAIYLPATTHNVKNVGETEVVIIETEIK